MVNQEALIKLGRSYAGAEVFFKEEWGSWYFSLAGKQFALMGTDASGREILTVKGPPEQNETLREQYEDISPGYYCNKTHWISLLLESDMLDDSLYEALLKQSHQLVFQKLTKKKQQEIIGGEAL